MFHYAFYKYLTKQGFNVYLDKKSPVSRNQHQKHESYRLDYFRLENIKYANKDDILEFIPKANELYSKPFFVIIKTEKIYTLFKVFFYKLIIKLRLERRKQNYFIEWDKSGKGKDFYRKMLGKNTRAYMVGRFQEHYYLKNIRDALLDDFAFKQEIPETVKEYYSKIIESNSVSIHVRRGDYIGIKEFDICSLKYYKNAASYISKLIKNPVYFIFSDDIEWIKINFTFLEKYIIVDNNRFDNSDYFDLFLMTNCKHNIIPNSTFSWWGAWLNQNPNKIVICPEKWNGFNYVNTDEICPLEWKRIDTH